MIPFSEELPDDVVVEERQTHLPRSRGFDRNKQPDVLFWSGVIYHQSMLADVCNPAFLHDHKHSLNGITDAVMLESAAQQNFTYFTGISYIYLVHYTQLIYMERDENYQYIHF